MKLFFLLLLSISLQAEKPVLFLLDKYVDDMNVTSWYMSEKLDGVRAYWDGKKLISRSGKVFKVPNFFIKDFPKYELDGELWTKRADFSHIVSIVNKKREHLKWNELTYNIFEVPNAKGDLLQRLQQVKEYHYMKVIKQIKVKSTKHLESYLKSIEDKNGEGLVVRDGSLAYYSGRNKSALKVKSFTDAECQVVGYKMGRNKYENMLGSLLCKMDNNQTIKIGSGFSDYERAKPPSIGTVITFKYYGLTSKKNPRFPIFLRIRKGHE